MVKKKEEKGIKRDKGGRYKKGTGGGPGRKKGEPQDVLCKDGKARSVTALVDDLLSTYSKLGSDKFLHAWAVRSHRNLTAFIQLLYKFAPPPEQLVTQEFKPLTIQVKEMPKGDAIAAMEKTIRDLGDRLREQDMELLRLRSIFSSHNITYEEIEHTPVRDKELPKHKDDDDNDKPGGGSDRVN